jgi:hypothetical protein
LKQLSKNETVRSFCFLFFLLFFPFGLFCFVDVPFFFVVPLSEVMVDLWASGRGFIGENDDPKKRIAKPILYARDESDTLSYGYGRPIEGLTPVIDLDEEKIISVEDLGLEFFLFPLNFLFFFFFFPAHFFLSLGVIPVAPKKSEVQKQTPKRSMEGEDVSGIFPPLKPLEIRQPEGPSFNLTNNHLSWQGWDFHIGFNAREGLCLLVCFFFFPLLFSFSFNKQVSLYTAFKFSTKICKLFGLFCIELHWQRWWFHMATQSTQFLSFFFFFFLFNFSTKSTFPLLLQIVLLRIVEMLSTLVKRDWDSMPIHSNSAVIVLAQFFTWMLSSIKLTELPN